MPIHRIEAPDGTIHEVEAPSGADPRALVQFVAQQVAAKAEADAAYDPGFLENLLTGLGQGAVGMGESVALGAATLMDEGNEAPVREAIQRVAGKLRPEGGDPDSITNMVGSGLGSVLPFLATAPLGVAALPAAGALGVAAHAGEASERAREAGVDEETRNAAIKKAAPLGVLEVAPLAKPISQIARKLGAPVFGKMIDDLGEEAVKGFTQRVRNAAMTGGFEAAQEVTTETLQNLIEQGYDPTQELSEGLAQSGGVGFSTGAIIRGLTDFLVPGKAKGADVGEETGDQTDTEQGAVDDVLGGVTAEAPPADAGAPPAPPAPRAPFDPNAEAEARRVALEKRKAERAAGVAAEEAAKQAEMDAMRERRKAAGVASAPAAPAETPVAEIKAPTLLVPPKAETYRTPDVPPAPADVTLEEAPAPAPAPAAPTPITKGKKKRVVIPPDFVMEEAPKRGSPSPAQQPTVGAGVQDAGLPANPVPDGAVQTDGGAGGAAAPTTPDTGLAGAVSDVAAPQVRTKAQQATLAPAPYEVQEVDDGNWAYGRTDADGVFTAEAEWFTSPEEAQAEAEVAATRAAPSAPAPAEEAQAALAPEAPGPARKFANKAAKQAALDNDVSPDELLEREWQGTGKGTNWTKKDVEDYVVTRYRDTVTPKPKAEPVIPTGKVEIPPPKAKAKPKPKAEEVDDNDPLVKALKEAEQEKIKAVMEAEQERVRETIAFDLLGKVPYAHLRDVPKIKVSRAHEAQIEAIKQMPTISKNKPKGVEFTPEEAQEREVKRTVQSYLRKYETLPRALDTAIYEVMHNVPAFKVQSAEKGEPVTKRDMENQEDLKEFYGHTGGEHARNFLQWVESTGIDIKAFRNGVEQFYSRQDTRAQNNEKQSIEKKVAGKYRAARLSVLMDAIEAKRRQATKIGDREVMEKSKGLQSAVRALVGGTDPAKLSKEQNATVRKLIRELDALPAVTEAIDSLDIEMHPAVIEIMKRGDLKNALRALEMTAEHSKVYQIAGTDIALLRDTAKRFADVVGDTKLKIVQNLKSEGKRVAGVFDPKTNTIKIDAEYASTPHTLLHEVTHALTVKVLINKSHPVTKQLQKLFDDVKDELGTAYGAKNLGEFVAEAYSNPKFQRELARILDSKGQTTAWQRFVDAIAKFLWRMVGKQLPIEHPSFKEFLKITDAILAPAPNFMNHTVFESAAVTGKLQEVMKGLGDKYSEAMREVEKNHPQRADTIYAIDEFVTGTANNKAKKILMGVLPSLPLSDVTDHVLGTKLGRQIHDTFLAHNKAMREALGKLSSTSAHMDNWAKENPERMKVLDKLHITATMAEVDPDPEAQDIDAANAATKGRFRYALDPTKREAFDEMAPQWEALGKEGQAIYREVRDTYRKLYKNLDNALTTRIVSMVEDKVLANNISNRITKEFQKRVVDPFFPLTREGDYWVTFVLEKEKDMPVYKAFTSERQRDHFVRRLREQEGKEIVEGSIDATFRVKSGRVENVPASGFVSDVLRVIQTARLNMPADVGPEVNKLFDDQTEQVMRMFIQRLPESSYAKAFAKRMGYGGADENIRLGFQRRALSMARDTVNVVYGKQMVSLIRKMEEHIVKSDQKNPAGNARKHGQVILDEWSERVRFASNPPNDWKAQWARFGNRVAFAGTIGFNPSSAALQLVQGPMVVTPYLAGKTNWNTAVKHIQTGLRLFGSSPTDFLVHNLLHNERTEKAKGSFLSRSLVNYYDIQSIKDADDNVIDEVVRVRDDIELTPEKRAILNKLAPLAKAMHDTAQDNNSIHYDTLEVDEFSTKATPAGKFWHGFNVMSAYMFHHSDRVTRQVTTIAGYLNELDRMATKPTAEERTLTEEQRQARAIDTALYDTQMTNGGNILSTAPRYAQTGIGRVAFMFKSYGIQMNYFALKNLLQTLKSNNPENYAQARRQVLGLFGMNMLFAGAAGLPFFGAAMALIDMFRDDDDPDADTLIRMAIGEELHRGALDQFTKALGGEGLSVSQRVSMSNIVFATNRFEFDPTVEKTIVTTLGGPLYGYLSSIGRGFTDIGQGNWERGVESILPAAFRNMYKGAVRYPRDGALTRRGDPVMEELTPGLLAGQFFGFAPAEYQRNQERNQILKGIDRTTNEKRTKLLRELYVAMRFGDDTSDIYDRVRQFNKKWPNHAISPETVRKSMKTHMETSARMHHGVLFTKAMHNEMLEMSREFDF